MKYVYISGGSGRQSIRSCDGRRLPKAYIIKEMNADPGSKFLFQKAPNHQTDVVILPDGVRYMSSTTFRKLRPGKIIDVLNWTRFERKYLRKCLFAPLKGNRSAGSSSNQIKQSYEEEKVLSQGTRRRWRLKRAQELLSKGSTRPSKTRGWSLDFPTRGKERQQLYQACGARCFLGPQLSFPICKRCGLKGCSCSIDPRGVQAAYQRARQWGHTAVAARADRLRRTNTNNNN